MMSKINVSNEQRTHGPLCGACWLEHNDIHCRCNAAVPSDSSESSRASRVRRDEEQLELF